MSVELPGFVWDHESNRYYPIDSQRAKEIKKASKKILLDDFKINLKSAAKHTFDLENDAFDTKSVFDPIVLKDVEDGSSIWIDVHDCQHAYMQTNYAVNRSRRQWVYLHSISPNGNLIKLADHDPLLPLLHEGFCEFSVNGPLPFRTYKVSDDADDEYFYTHTANHHQFQELYMRQRTLQSRALITEKSLINTSKAINHLCGVHRPNKAWDYFESAGSGEVFAMYKRKIKVCTKSYREEEETFLLPTLPTSQTSLHRMQIDTQTNTIWAATKNRLFKWDRRCANKTATCMVTMDPADRCDFALALGFGPGGGDYGGGGRIYCTFDKVFIEWDVRWLANPRTLWEFPAKIKQSVVPTLDGRPVIQIAH